MITAPGTADWGVMINIGVRITTTSTTTSTMQGVVQDGFCILLELVLLFAHTTATPIIDG